MYAVFQSGGKQHRVAEGQTLRLEKIEVAPGESIEFDDILMVSNGDDIKIGTPFVSGSKVPQTGPTARRLCVPLDQRPQEARTL